MQAGAEHSCRQLLIMRAQMHAECMGRHLELAQASILHFNCTTEQTTKEVKHNHSRILLFSLL